MVDNPGYEGLNASVVSSGSSDDDCVGPCTCCSMAQYCKCGIEAEQRESNDNYRRRYIRCHKTDDMACDFFEFVDPEYTPRSMQVIDDLVEEQIEQRDALLIDRNHRVWDEEQQVESDRGLKLELTNLRDMFHVSLAVIVVLVGIIVVGWMR